MEKVGPPKRSRLGPGRSVPYGDALGPLLVLALRWAASAAGFLEPASCRHPGPCRAVWRSRSGGPGWDCLGATAGIALALIAGLNRVGEAVVDGWMQAQRSVPTLGLIPLMILWLGIGETFKVAIIAIVVAIIMYIQTYSGLGGSSSAWSCCPVRCPASYVKRQADGAPVAV